MSYRTNHMQLLHITLVTLTRCFNDKYKRIAWVKQICYWLQDKARLVNFPLKITWFTVWTDRRLLVMRQLSRSQAMSMWPIFTWTFRRRHSPCFSSQLLAYDRTRKLTYGRGPNQLKEILLPEASNPKSDSKAGLVSIRLVVQVQSFNFKSLKKLTLFKWYKRDF